MADASIADAPWSWPVDVTVYDRTPRLSADERVALGYLCTRHVGAAAGPWPAWLGRALARLADPLRAAAAALELSAGRRCKATRLLLRETWRRDVSLWAWTADDWVTVIGPTMPAFLARHGTSAHVLRQPVLGVAYLLADFTSFERFPGHSLEPTTLARTVFGPARMHEALTRVLDVLRAWGYAPSIAGRLHTALAYALLRARSPALEALTRDGLAGWYDAAHAAAAYPCGTAYALTHLYPLSRALTHLGILPAPIPRHSERPPLATRLAAARPLATPAAHADTPRCTSRRASPAAALTAAIAPEWVDWCLAWHARAVLSPGAKRAMLYTLLQVGRWLARTHPTVTSPAQWDYELAADFVAAVDQLTTEAWRAPGLAHRGGPPAGTPLMPRTKAGRLSRLRRFFLDLQEVPHRPAGAPADAPGEVLPRRFDPRRALRTPRAIYQLIGPDPRVIDERWWLKLLHAAESLDASDLGPARRALYPLELARAVAVTWVLSGLRTDELRRLRVGCVRMDGPMDGALEQRDEGSEVPRDAVCVLSVPVHKTGTAFSKPVHALVGRRIADWERVRPAQAPALDWKTNERVHFLFAVRQRPIGPAYLNLRLIPLLCRKANVPPLDARGRITAHRARATLASALYNAPGGLSLDELGEWLGHKDLRATQHYAKLHPTRLVRAVARANQQARLVPVLVDPAAAGRGEPALFYALGAGAYCANPAWAACPHRLACLKCPMYVPRDVGQRIEARAGVQRLLQEVPLTAEERAVAEGDVVALTRYIAERRDVPPPPVPTPDYIFNPSAGGAGCTGQRSTSDPLAG